jgi:hypothetical protein
MGMRTSDIPLHIWVKINRYVLLPPPEMEDPDKGKVGEEH